MQSKSFSYPFLLLLTVFLFGRCTKPTNQNSSSPCFRLLSSQSTHIYFENRIKESPVNNLLLYEYFYNGGGVAIGDVNNDGLDDVYFSSNAESNKLYLNRGGMSFQDISVSAGVEGKPNSWKTGVTMVDVNGDNLLDIFVCYSGNTTPELRTKQLFINKGNDTQGIPHFVDVAKEYGLDNTSTSTQSSFFDYDHDGDLDMLLLNHNIKNLPTLNITQAQSVIQQEDSISGVRLYRHDVSGNSHHFMDVTRQAHISSSPLSYGLGVGVADINNDGWQDVYISNDYAAPDYLYINDTEGGFVNTINQSLDYYSQFSMGNDIADVNNDGQMDIYTLDMLPEDNRRQKLLMGVDNLDKFNLNVSLGFGKQYMRNMLHLNISTQTLIQPKTNQPIFSEIGQLAGVSNTDWSWSALFADYDNDGFKDLYVTNGFLRDFTNMDFVKYMNDFIADNRSSMSREKVLKMIEQMPSSHVVNYMFRNSGNLMFENMTKNWGLDYKSNSNGAAYADLDNDGDLDLVVNNINSPAFVYENLTNKNKNFIQIELKGEGLNTHGIGAKISIYTEGGLQYQEAMPTHGYQSSVSPIVHFGIGNHRQVDSIIIDWLNGASQVLKNIEANQRIKIEEKNAQKHIKTGNSEKVYDFVESDILNYKHIQDSTSEFYIQPLMTYPTAFNGPCMTKGDLNNDGLEDIFVGGGKNQSSCIYLQTKEGTFLKKNNAVFEADKAYYDTDVAIFDANSDGYKDIYVSSGATANFVSDTNMLQDRLYLNDGKANFTKAALPLIVGSKSCVKPNDINHDGLEDIFIGSRLEVGKYPTAPRSFLLINKGNGNFIEKTPPILQYIGMVTDAQWYDLDHDKIKELIIVGEAMPITVLKMKGDDFIDVTNTFFEKKYNGFWNKIQIDDLNKDGEPEILVGNLGENTQLKAEDEQPINLFFGDFDKNGSIDPILSTYIQGVVYPYLTRDELGAQLPFFRKKFTNYESYSNTQTKEIVSQLDKSSLQKLTVNCTKTRLFSKMVNGRFKEIDLPIEAQFSTVNSIHFLDIDNVGLKDIFLGGNIQHTRPKLGDISSNKGFFFLNKNGNRFAYLGHLNIKNDVRSSLNIGNNFLLGINGGKILNFKKNKSRSPF